MCLLCCAGGASADCGERLREAELGVGFELTRLRVDRETAQEAEAVTQGQETAFRALFRYPPEEYPEDYDEALARRVRNIRRKIIRPKRRRLLQLRDQVEETHRMQEQQVRQDQARFFEAGDAYRENLLSHDEYCQVREEYFGALTRYRTELERYRTGLRTYASALSVYREQFMLPAIRGFDDPPVWTALVERFGPSEKYRPIQDDQMMRENPTEAPAAGFLQEYLDTLSANLEPGMAPNSPSPTARGGRKRLDGNPGTYGDGGAREGG